jgi:DNA-binding Lrp family transcriptional regulator
MLKINQFVAKRLESYANQTFKYKVDSQFISYVKVLNYITDQQLLQHKGENKPVQVSLRNIADKLSLSIQWVNKHLHTLTTIGVITRSGYWINTEEEKQAYSYSFVTGCEWLGVYLDLDIEDDLDRISLPNLPFYKEYIKNLKEVSQQWYYDTNTTVLGRRLIFPEQVLRDGYRVNHPESDTPLVSSSSFNHTTIFNSSSSSNISMSDIGISTVNHYSKLLSKKDEVKEGKNSPYSSETHKISEIKKVKKADQIKLNKKIIRATQPHLESRVYTHLTSMKRDDRKSLKWGAQRYPIKQADMHAAQIYLVFAMFIQSGGKDDVLASMLTQSDFYLSMIEQTNWEGAWMWDSTDKKMEWVTGRKGFQRYFFAEILYSTCADMRSSKWGTEVFRRMFPDFWQFVYDCKNEVGSDEFSHMRDNARYAHRVAVLEWNHIRAALEYLYENGYPAVSLHDAIVFPSVVPDSVIVQAINKSFGIYSVLPKIKIEAL